MTAPTAVVIEGDVLEVVVEEENVVLELWSGFGDGDATHLRGVPISVIAPTSGQALVYSAGSWVATNVATQLELDAVSAAAAAALATHAALTNNPHAVTKAQVGLGNVEDTALSTWAGSASITTLGTITTGTIPMGRLSGATLALDSSGSQREIQFNTNGVNRWLYQVTGTETGSDVGSDFRIQARTDAGALIDTALQITRAAGGTFKIARPILLSTATSGTGASIIANTLLDIAGASGSATLVPVRMLLRSTTNAGDWATGATNFFAAYGIYSHDASGPGAGVRVRLSAHMETAGGGATGLALWVAPAGGITVALTLNSDLTANFAGAIQRAGTQVVNTRRTGWTTVPTGTLNRTTFVSDSVTLPDLAARVAALIIDLHSSAAHGLIGP